MPRNDEYGMPYMRIHFSTTVIAYALLFALSVTFVVPHSAYAVVPVAEPCIPWLSFQCLKKTILDPATTTIAKKLIRQLRASTVNWILTGDFEIKKPFFVTSFIADPQRIADNAARTFLSGLIGINFCNFHPNIRSVRGLNINISLDTMLSCSANVSASGRIPDTWAGLYQAVRPENNFSRVTIDVLSEKDKAVARGVSAFAEEVRSGAGFLGQRDPKTGKINTPGRIIVNSLQNADLSQQFGTELVDEFYEAVVEIIDVAVGTTIKKGLSL